LIPVDGTWESVNATEVDGDVSVSYGYTLGSRVLASFSPKSCTAGVNVIKFELDVVVTIRDYGTSVGLKTSLEVKITGGSSGSNNRGAERENGTKGKHD
jgi:hypothetical protein